MNINEKYDYIMRKYEDQNFTFTSKDFKTFYIKFNEIEFYDTEMILEENGMSDDEIRIARTKWLNMDNSLLKEVFVNAYKSFLELELRKLK